ncbi:MAG TPA: NUDIX domain-containing protein [Roseiflexaceae bacterium]|nr:NUDIX domain-containing protein [Roseiflexaceae bacterium]HMP38776.1 NUDIX domain-containing protein [Roseiflexaceae bacterium]
MSANTPIPIAVVVAVIDADRVLLTRREDFEIWCLPGGAIEPGESLVEAARREVREETGFEVVIDRLVGLYSRPNFGGYHTAVVFAGRIVGGAALPQPSEVIEMDFFTAATLPEDLLWGHRQRVLDALNGVGGSYVSTIDTGPPSWPAKRSELYAMRDNSGLSRTAFYNKHIAILGPDVYRREIGGVEE